MVWLKEKFYQLLRKKKNKPLNRTKLKEDLKRRIMEIVSMSVRVKTNELPKLCSGILPENEYKITYRYKIIYDVINELWRDGELTPVTRSREKILKDIAKTIRRQQDEYETIFDEKFEIHEE